MYQFTHVNGKKVADIKIYALSTCIWCRKTKKLLDELGAAYDFVDVDLLPDADSDAADAEVQKWNKNGTYPTMVIDGKKALTGFAEDEIREMCGK